MRCRVQAEQEQAAQMVTESSPVPVDTHTAGSQFWGKQLSQEGWEARQELMVSHQPVGKARAAACLCCQEFSLSW